MSKETKPQGENMAALSEALRPLSCTWFFVGGAAWAAPAISRVMNPVASAILVIGTSICVVEAPHARTGHAQLAAAERQLPRRHTPVKMRAPRIVPARWASQGGGFLAKHRIERHEPGPLHPTQQLVPRGRHPVDERSEQPHQAP
jgi:hypothetical protein